MHRHPDTQPAAAAGAVEAGLSLGSNLGDRLAHLRAARTRLAALPGVRIVAAAPVYETEPVGVTAAHRDLGFLNTVLILACPLPPAELAAAAHAIEAALGRRRSPNDRYAPRPIDIDILYIGDRVLRDDDLTIPHPEWTRRRFVVQPLADVRPALVLPGESRTCRAVLSALPSVPEVVLLLRDW
jgi:2-amino-4-hydroxy-6-hydroxymethyldihydropteridine diphosphokinase